MEAVRENSVVVKPLNKEQITRTGLVTSGFTKFNEGKVVSSNFVGIKKDDIIIYDDSLEVGEYLVVFEHNIIAKK